MARARFGTERPARLIGKGMVTRRTAKRVSRSCTALDQSRRMDGRVGAGDDRGPAARCEWAGRIGHVITRLPNHALRVSAAEAVGMDVGDHFGRGTGQGLPALMCGFAKTQI